MTENWTHCHQNRLFSTWYVLRSVLGHTCGGSVRKGFPKLLSAISKAERTAELELVSLKERPTRMLSDKKGHRQVTPADPSGLKIDFSELASRTVLVPSAFSYASIADKLHWSVPSTGRVSSSAGISKALLSSEDHRYLVTTVVASSLIP